MGRRAAAEALGEFNGAEANALVVRALEDEDPQVQANVLGQLRRRGILGALPRLLEMVDSSYAVVREAARTSLNEFSFQRFLAAFDMLEDEVRQSVGKLVKKIDPQTIPQLQAELGSSLRTRRLRALAIAPAIQAVPPVEGKIVALLQDGDHLVRAEAARALAQGKLRVSWEGLQQALEDPNAFVREAAQKSIRDRTRPRRQGAGDHGPDSRGQAR
jgi:HEAT repeat protein